MTQAVKLAILKLVLRGHQIYLPGKCFKVNCGCFQLLKAQLSNTSNHFFIYFQLQFLSPIFTNLSNGVMKWSLQTLQIYYEFYLNTLVDYIRSILSTLKFPPTANSTKIGDLGRTLNRKRPKDLLKQVRGSTRIVSFIPCLIKCARNKPIQGTTVTPNLKGAYV